MTAPPIIAIVGPTASGKTHKAAALCRSINAEIVSADSRQIYRGMDIGTGKDIAEYGTDIPYHLIDIAPAGYKYNLYEYIRDARRALEDVASRGKTAVICGGTGLYVETLLKGTVLPDVPQNDALRLRYKDTPLDELTQILARYKSLHNTTDVDTAQRAIRAIEIEEFYRANPVQASLAHNPVPLDATVIGIDIDRDARRSRISARLQYRFKDQHMLDEVKGLLDSGIAPDDLIYYGLEYKFLTQYLTGKITRAEMESGLETSIHQFAKRQMTWFRGMERRGFTIHWLPYDMPDDEFVDAAVKIAQ